MSHYHPELISSEELKTHSSSIQNLAYNEDSEDQPQVKFSRLQLHTITEPVAIFDLDPEITVIIDDSHVPSTVFDYLNPLLLDSDSVDTRVRDPQRPGKILFYLHEEQQFELSCYQLYSKQDLHEISEMTVYYPPSYYIDYKSVKVNRTGNANVFWKCNTPQTFRNVPTLENMLDMFTGRLYGIITPSEEEW